MKFLQIVFSALTGAVVGLLFAKKDGKQIREDLKGKDSKEIAEYLGKELMEVGKDVAHFSKENLEQLSVTKNIQQKGEELSSMAKKEIVDLADKAKKGLTDIQENLKKESSEK